MLKRLCCMLLALLMTGCMVFSALGEMLAVGETGLHAVDDIQQIIDEQPLTPRDDLINRIIDLGEHLYEKAGGHPQRAHYKNDIYVCKNFTTYVFNQNRADFRMAAYPKVKLLIPNNLPASKCKPYAYGYAWQDVPAAKGNPFEAAAQFLYQTDLSEEQNMALALDFLKQIKRGDFFQMTASYSAGTGAHSAIMIADYDPQTGKLHWMDSNMRGTRKEGIRYGYVQFDAQAPIEWWAEAFCMKKRGATIYRLRDDIIYRTDMKK